MKMAIHVPERIQGRPPMRSHPNQMARISAAKIAPNMTAIIAFPKTVDETKVATIATAGPITNADG
jgi:hypothetical protein